MSEGAHHQSLVMEMQTELKGHANYDAFADLEEGQEALVEEANSEGDEEFEVEEEDTEDEAAQDEEDEDEDQDQDHMETAKEEPKVNEPVPEDVKVLPGFPFENISCYAGVMMMVQHRSHLFTTLICGRFARFIRWDRSGAIVSKRFDYTKEKTLLFNFYSRFAQLLPSQRGKDPTVSPLTDPDEDAIARAKFKHFDTDMWHGDAGPKAKRFISIEEQKLLRIEMTVNNKICRFVICAPKFNDSAFSPFGQSTRRSLAIDLDSPDLKDASNEGLLFMKDYWREDFASDGQRIGPKMETGDDIPDMVTITQQYARTLPNQLDGYHLPTLQAHRIFLKTIGRDLTTFCSVKSLVTCIADAMKAHQVAFHRTCILHRDISVGNIMITSNHRGFLIDWDHCVILTDRGADMCAGRTVCISVSCPHAFWLHLGTRIRLWMIENPRSGFSSTWRYDILPIHFNQLHYIMV
ncbi:hypothetical protein EDD18DRAFT_1218735 [Armillaria luteobubalina]|uniref:Fungal-type protein kinase domain-containing protein n=1 Tax=Armillaria luteobubalina TaxID=153913 RepID=A0AA39P0H9_9AGAR|nr:hypothetical protein EDD18DRAFT_1218735 [Armillaria luteobubalina]